jgi:hypothetical protein
MPPDISSCAAKAGLTKPKIRKRSSRRQDTNATREMFIVFFAVKIETPRDANTHDGHVKSRGISPPRGLRRLCGQRRLSARSSRQRAANPICIPAFRLPAWTFDKVSVGRRQGFVGNMSSLTLQSRTFCGYSNDTLSQEKAWLVLLHKAFSLN